MRFKRLRLVSRNELLVFGFSLVMVISLLVMERAVGIGWNYHADSVTYATLSDQMSSNIYNGNRWMLFNNGYYVISSFLGMSIVGITIMNMIIFSYTNVMIYRVHRDASRFLSKGKPIWILCLLLLLCNPYRIHLGTTMLKDSLIIMFLVYALSNKASARVALMPILAVFRIASLIYFIIFLRRKYILIGAVCALLIWMVLWDALNVIILDFNSSEMQFREFDRVLTFQDLGVAGALIRGIVWPLLAFSGAYVLLSPAAPFMMVYVGIFGGLVYIKLMTGRIYVPLSVYAVMVVFGVLVTGYTSYLRYVYPVLVLAPLIVVQATTVINRSVPANHT